MSMLAVRIVPTLLARGSTLVKGERFNGWRSVGHVQQAASIHAARGVDELIVLDIAATPEGRGPNIALVEELTAQAFTPITVGGGVRSVEDVDALLRAGADKVSIRSAWETMKRCADRFGSQAIVAAVDVVTAQSRVFGNVCMRECAADRAAWCEEQGAGEILLTSIDREGTMQGYDLDLIRAVASAVDIPVIAHGGCSGPDDMIAAVKAGASAVAAGALFQFTDWTPRACAEYMAERGIETRIPA